MINEDLFPPNYYCPRPDFDLENGYDAFIQSLSWDMRKKGRIDVENIIVRCDGKCPKGCEKKFKLKLGKSITKKKFDKIAEHGKKYQEHCMTLIYDGVIKNGPIL